MKVMVDLDPRDVWMIQSRAEATGRTFDVKEWHMAALALGSVGLDVLREALR